MLPVGPDSPLLPRRAPRTSRHRWPVTLQHGEIVLAPLRPRDGATWERVLFRDENTGAIDLSLDPTNPRVLYAALWQTRRTPCDRIRQNGDEIAVPYDVDQRADRIGFDSNPWRQPVLLHVVVNVHAGDEILAQQT